METTYQFQFMPDMTADQKDSPSVLLKCELCGDCSEEHKTLVLDNEFNFCLACVRRGRLHKQVLKYYPTESISPTIKLINNFIFANL